jgi:hypothetical protein
MKDPSTNMYKNPPELTNCITHPEFYDAPIG